MKAPESSGASKSQTENQSFTRRFFFKKTSTALIAGGGAACGLAAVPLLQGEELRLRPPGALAERVFLASCIKCGQCLQVCPPQVIQLAGLRDGFGIGTPYIVPKEGACILCKGLPCVLACPTGALDHHLSEGKDAEMGLAVVHPDTCLAKRNRNEVAHALRHLSAQQGQGGFGEHEEEHEHAEPPPNSKVPRTSASQTSNENPPTPDLQATLAKLLQRLTPEEADLLDSEFEVSGTPEQRLQGLLDQPTPQRLEQLERFYLKTQSGAVGCRVCLERCPIASEAPIVFVPDVHPKNGKPSFRPVVQQSCVGCGVCEQYCPTSPASITITPRMRWGEGEAA